MANKKKEETKQLQQPADMVYIDANGNKVVEKVETLSMSEVKFEDTNKK